MSVVNAAGDLEARYRRALRDPTRRLNEFLHLSLEFGDALIDIDPERSERVFSAAVELLRDPPIAIHLELSIVLAEKLAAVRRSLDQLPAEYEALLAAVRMIDHLPLELGFRRRATVVRQMARIDITLARVDEGLDLLADLVEQGLGSDHHPPADGEDFEQLVVALGLGVSAVIPGPDVRRRLEELLASSRSSQRSEREVDLAAVLSLAHMSVGDHDVAAIYERRSRMIASRLGHRPIIARWASANVALTNGDIDRSIDLFGELLMEITAGTLDELRFDVLSGLGESAWLLGDANGARIALREALLVGKGGERRLARTHEVLAELEREAGRLEDAYEHLAATRRFESSFLRRTARAADRRAAVHTPILNVAEPDPVAMDRLSPGMWSTDPQTGPTPLDDPPRTTRGPALVPDLIELPDTIDLTSPNLNRRNFISSGPAGPPDELIERLDTLERLVDDRTRQLEQALIDLRDLSERSLHDPLTELVNRAGLREILANWGVARTPGAVLSLDLDRFGRINESLGHQAGDQLLAEIAQRLQRTVRPGDVVARWGSDEFVVLLAEVVEPSAVMAMADLIGQAIAVPWHAPGDEKVVPSASIGVTSAPNGLLDADLVLRQADTALQRARSLGRGRVECFGEELGAHARSRYERESLFRDALSNGWFEMWFQPVHPNDDDYPLAAEALIRLRHPDGRILAPAAFLDVAEEIGLAATLGSWVLDESCRIASGWTRAGVPFRLAVNVSASQLDDQFAELVSRTLRTHGLDPSLLVIELTEHTLLEADESQVAALVAIRDSGVRIALDDFGTAYSSLTHLRRFPVDVVKIDRSFIAGICTNVQDSAIVRAVVELSRTFGFRVIAEGVETAEQLDMQRRLGCHGAQGYLIGPPRPADAFERLLTARPLLDLLAAMPA